MLDSQKSSYEAWDLFRRRGRLDATALRPHVLSAWERSVSQKADPRSPQAERLSPTATARLLTAKAELVSAAHPYMLALSTAAGDRHHAAMLGDENSVVLDVIGDDSTVRGMEPFPGPGSLLSEALSGANGIGSPLAAGGYVEFVGTEHFIEGFHPFTCQGIPLLAADGSVMGVLSTSVRQLAASQRIREIFLIAARGIEAELIWARLERSLRQAISESHGTAFALKCLREDVLQASAVGRMSLELAAESLDTSPESANSLLPQALAAINRFRSQSNLCLDLVSAHTKGSEPVAVGKLITEVIQLLATEQEIQGVHLHQDFDLGLELRLNRSHTAKRVMAFLLALLRQAKQRETLAALDIGDGYVLTAIPPGHATKHSTKLVFHLDLARCERTASGPSP